MEFREREFYPILLGTDINVYSMARAFHEAYGVRSLMIARALTGATNHSKLLDYREEPHLDQKEDFLRVMNDVYEKYRHLGKSLLLIGCTDHYVRLIIENRAALEDKYVLPYPTLDVLDNIVLKETFYQRCEQYGLDFAATFVHGPNTGYDFDLDFGYPVVLKPSDSVKYQDHHFEGFHKVFFIDDRQSLNETLKKIYAGGYDGNMIIQDMIPGEDANIYDLHGYVASDQQLKLINMGNVVLEQHSPTAIGNNAATLVEPHRDVMEKAKALLEGIGWVGFFDGDLKYDPRDGKFKMLEINIRQGQSNYRVTGGGDNLAWYVTEDFIYHKTLPGPKFVEEDYFWHVVPLGLVYKYVKDQDKLAKIRQLVQQGKVCHSLYYPGDLAPKRLAYLRLRDINMYRKFRKYVDKA